MKRFLCLLLLLAGFEFALGAGTVTVTRRTYGTGTVGKRVEVVTLSFTADASGNADKVVGLHGRLVKVVTNPDGDAAPSANWDAYFYDAEDTTLSLTSTALENRHTANTEQIYPLIAGAPGTVTAVPPLAAGNYTFTVANAGSGGAGRVLVYLE